MKRTGTSLAFAFLFILLLIPVGSDGAHYGTQPAGQGGEEFESHELYDAWNKRFVAEKNGIVTDTKTGLQWLIGPDKDTTWDEANAWVESLDVDGGRWRMPTRKELESLYREGAGTRNMSPLFKTSGEYGWTGETVAPSYAWGFCFGIGNAYWPLRTFSDTARAFAVRTAKESSPTH